MIKNTVESPNEPVKREVKFTVEDINTMLTTGEVLCTIPEGSIVTEFKVNSVDSEHLVIIKWEE